MRPAYLNLPEGELQRRAELAREMAQRCNLCPRQCRVDRTADEAGACGIGAQAKLASANLHFGEEPPISAQRGSGTLFFSGCNLRCAFCQNYPISQLMQGRPVSTEDLADAMLGLQARGAHNINLVTPSHVTWHVLEGLRLAAGRGLRLPIVYNSSGYEGLRALRLLDGVIDIYLPDLKYADDDNALRISDARDYWTVATTAVREMRRQVGDLEVNGDGSAKRGLLVRHLVLPGGLAGTERVLDFLAAEIGCTTHVSLMRQYFPANRAHARDDLCQRVSDAHWLAACEALERAGLAKGWIQQAS